MKYLVRRGTALLALLSTLIFGVATVAAQQTPTPTAQTAARSGGWLGLPWWLWIVLGLLLLFLLWWLFLRRRPVPPPPPPPEPTRTATGSAAVYEPPARMAPPPPIAPMAPPMEPPVVEGPPTRMGEPMGTMSEPMGGLPDDLKRIEGIGPRIENILNGAGITTFAALANTPVDRLRQILMAAELRGSFGDPTTWPEQARLAAAGAWAELKILQDNLKGGR